MNWKCENCKQIKAKFGFRWDDKGLKLLFKGIDCRFKRNRNNKTSLTICIFFFLIFFLKGTIKRTYYIQLKAMPSIETIETMKQKWKEEWNPSTPEIIWTKRYGASLICLRTWFRQNIHIALIIFHVCSSRTYKNLLALQYFVIFETLPNILITKHTHRIFIGGWPTQKNQKWQNTS